MEHEDGKFGELFNHVKFIMEKQETHYTKLKHEMNRGGRFASVVRQNNQRQGLLNPKITEHEENKFGELFSDIKSLTSNMESLITHMRNQETQMQDQKTEIESMKKMIMKGSSDVE